jgi:acetyl-CoA carboxylase biotin carboxyl carrier protein
VNEAQLRQLLKLFAESEEVEELEIQHSFWRGTRIRLSRQRPSPPPYAAAPPAAASPQAMAAPALQDSAPPPSVPATAADGLHVVAAPMVGTFYRASSPEAAPFASAGDQVRVGQTLCIIEAMKIMNEIPSDIDGEVVEILVENAAPVEYNQPLIHIRPA